MSSKVEAWKCDYCSRCFVKKACAKIHERACQNSPLKKSCKTCKWMGKRERNQLIGGEDIQYTVLCCLFHNKDFEDKPYFEFCEEEPKSHYSDYGPEPDEYDGCIPFTCKAYEYKGYAAWEDCKFLDELAEELEREARP
jgi:hypothetical protein